MEFPARQEFYRRVRVWKHDLLELLAPEQRRVLRQPGDFRCFDSRWSADGNSKGSLGIAGTSKPRRVTERMGTRARCVERRSRRMGTRDRAELFVSARLSMGAHSGSELRATRGFTPVCGRHTGWPR